MEMATIGIPPVKSTTSSPVVTTTPAFSCPVPNTAPITDPMYRTEVIYGAEGVYCSQIEVRIEELLRKDYILVSAIPTHYKQDVSLNKEVAYRLISVTLVFKRK